MTTTSNQLGIPGVSSNAPSLDTTPITSIPDTLINESAPVDNAPPFVIPSVDEIAGLGKGPVAANRIYNEIQDMVTEFVILVKDKGYLPADALTLLQKNATDTGWDVFTRFNSTVPKILDEGPFSKNLTPSASTPDKAVSSPDNSESLVQAPAAQEPTQSAVQQPPTAATSVDSGSTSTYNVGSLDSRLILEKINKFREHHKMQCSIESKDPLALALFVAPSKFFRIDGSEVTYHRAGVNPVVIYTGDLDVKKMLEAIERQLRFAR